jgi:hypothetical protein
MATSRVAAPGVMSTTSPLTLDDRLERHTQVEISNKNIYKIMSTCSLHPNLAVHFVLSVLLQVGLLGGTC